jgi:hypothetical protein
MITCRLSRSTQRGQEAHVAPEADQDPVKVAPSGRGSCPRTAPIRGFRIFSPNRSLGRRARTARTRRGRSARSTSASWWMRARHRRSGRGVHGYTLTLRAAVVGALGRGGSAKSYSLLTGWHSVIAAAVGPRVEDPLDESTAIDWYRRSLRIPEGGARFTDGLPRTAGGAGIGPKGEGIGFSVHPSHGAAGCRQAWEMLKVGKGVKVERLMVKLDRDDRRDSGPRRPRGDRRDPWFGEADTAGRASSSFPTWKPGGGVTRRVSARGAIRVRGLHDDASEET